MGCGVGRRLSEPVRAGGLSWAAGCGLTVRWRLEGVGECTEDDARAARLCESGGRGRGGGKGVGSNGFRGVPAELSHTGLAHLTVTVSVRVQCAPEERADGGREQAERHTDRQGEKRDGALCSGARVGVRRGRPRRARGRPRRRLGSRRLPIPRAGTAAAAQDPLSEAPPTRISPRLAHAQSPFNEGSPGERRSRR